jgi:hypothetical protein
MGVGTLRDGETGRCFVLEPDCLVGRSQHSGLRIVDRFVSYRHAAIRWTGEAWEVKDLGSRNGTFVNGGRLNAGAGLRLRRGTQLAFGVSQRRWELIDDSAPQVMIVAIDGDCEPVLIEGGILALPSADNPNATIYRRADGAWLVETEQAIVPIQPQGIIEVDNRSWRFCAPEQIPQTSVSGSPTRELADVELHFTVSRDEEHVDLRLSCQGDVLALGTRSHDYLLLTLARRRLADAAAGLPDGDCGWIDQAELEDDRSVVGPQLNVDVFRIRRRFAALGILDAANIVERRPRGKRLRIGTSKLVVTRP